MGDFDAWLDDYKPFVSSAKVCGRPDLIAEHTRRDLALHAARLAASDIMHDPDLAAAKAAVRDIEAEIEASQRDFHFRGIGHRKWQDLKRQYPPSELQRRENLDCDMERFAPALIAASAYDPEITQDQADRLYDKLPPGEFQKLWEAALEANGQVIGAPKSVLAAVIEQLPLNGASSITVASAESLEASSSDVLDEVSRDIPTTNGAG